MEEGGDRAAALQRLRVAGQYRPDARLIEHADLAVADVGSLDQSLVEVENVAVVVKGAAAFMAPGTGDRGDAACCVHVEGAVARA